jgi:putative ABC transport system permease protein
MAQDFRLALRRFWFNPGRTALLIAVLGLGLGTATAVFSVVDQTILRPPPFAHAERLVEVLDLYRSAGARSSSLTPEKIAGWQSQHSLFEAFEGFASRQFDLTAAEMEPERVRGLVVSIGLLRMLDVQPALGRGFADTDGRPGGERVALISEGLWRRRFGGRADVLGARAVLSEEPHTIVGVMPRRFRLTGEGEDVWLPIDVRATGGSAAPSRFLGIGRLAPGVDGESSQEIADTLAARLQAQTPLAAAPYWDIHLSRLKVAHVGETTATALFVLLGAVGFVLLITCANTANLFMSQVGFRQHETAVRAAIGATRVRLLREVLTESLVLAICGGAVGLLFATWGLEGIVAAAPPDLTFNSTSPIELDNRILAVAAAMTLVTAIVFGLAPAVRGSRTNPDGVLKSARGVGALPLSRFASALVVAEVAFSLILLVGAALMIRTFVNLQSIDPGFESDGLVAMEVSLPTDKYVGEGARSAFFAAVREHLASAPGVADVAVAAGVFGGGGVHFATPEVEDGSPLASSAAVTVPANDVTAEYFRTMRIPLLAGRTFADGDGSDAIVISEALASRYWPNGDAVGRGMKLFANGQWETVVGVAGNVEGRAGGIDSPLFIYRQLARPSPGSGSGPRARGYATRVVVVRTSDAAAAVPAMRAAVWAVDRNQPIGRIRLVDDMYAAAFARERFVLQLMTVFGLIAVVLTAAGIFAVLSQLVSRKTREIGLRLALGARRADILRLVLSRSAVLVVIGSAAGLGGAALLTRFLGVLLFGVQPLDPLSFATVTLVLLAIAFAACWLPARAAMRVDPAVALRD